MGFPSPGFKEIENGPAGLNGIRGESNKWEIKNPQDDKGDEKATTASTLTLSSIIFTNFGFSKIESLQTDAMFIHNLAASNHILGLAIDPPLSIKILEKFLYISIDLQVL